MTGRDRAITGSNASKSSTSGIVSVLVTGLAIVAVFVALGVVSKVVYDAAPRTVAFPSLLVTLAVLGFGGLYAILRLRDRLGS